jgi:hypothetical protein
MRLIYRVLALLLSWWLVLLPISVIVIWFSYDMSSVIKGGAYSLSEARALVLKMSIITMIMLSLSVIPSARSPQFKSRISLFLSTVFWAAIPLFAYTSWVFWWRERWTPEKGMDEYAAFGPVVGHVNAAFFAEFNFLTYLLIVLPALSIIAGVLSIVYARLIRQKPLLAGL